AAGVDQEGDGGADALGPVATAPDMLLGLIGLGQGAGVEVALGVAATPAPDVGAHEGALEAGAHRVDGAGEALEGGVVLGGVGCVEVLAGNDLVVGAGVGAPHVFVGLGRDVQGLGDVELAGDGVGTGAGAGTFGAGV